MAACNLAIALRALGRPAEALPLNEEILTDRVGDSAKIASPPFSPQRTSPPDLRVLGHHDRALAIEEDAFPRRRKMLGDHHWRTLHRARILSQT